MWECREWWRRLLVHDNIARTFYRGDGWGVGEGEDRVRQRREVEGRGAFDSQHPPAGPDEEAAGRLET